MVEELTAAARRLLRRPLSSALSVGVLAIGLGASLLVWSWIYSMVWRPFPGVLDSGRLRVVGSFPEHGEPISLSVPDALDLRTELAEVADVAAIELQAVSVRVISVISGKDGASGAGAVGRSGVGAAGAGAVGGSGVGASGAEAIRGSAAGAAPERAYAGMVSSNYFSMLGLTPQAGAFFRPEDDRAGSEPAVVLSHKMWTRRFGGDAGVVGRSLEINRRPFTIVGVAPREFLGTEVGLSLDLWVPLGTTPFINPGGNLLEERGHHWLRGLARLRPGVDARAAQAAMDGVTRRLAAAYPETNRPYRFRMMTIVESPWGATHFMAPVLWVLGAMVLLVLAATAANVASLLLVRARERRGELAIRLALGADRGRLLRALAAENVLLALAALGLGALVLPLSKALFLSFLPPVSVPVDPRFDIGPLGIAVGIALALLVALGAGIAPALDLRDAHLDSALREAGERGGGRRQRRFRGLLVGTQVALGFVLIAIGALFLRAVNTGSGIAPGFRAERLLLADVDLFPLGYDEAGGKQFLANLRDQIAAHPGVQSASLSRRLPLDLGGSSSVEVTVDGYTPAADEEALVMLNQIGRDYFATMGIPLLAGREFAAAEVLGDPAAETVVVVSAAMAKRYWPGGDALDRRIAWGERGARVVGIAGDVAFRERDESPRSFFYVPIGQYYRPGVTLIVRTEAEPLAFVPDLRRIVASADAALPLGAIKSMDEHLEISLIKQRVAATMLSLFGGVAVVLAVVGLYGVVALALRQRLRELALRSALGASPRELVRLTVGEGVRTAAIGLAAGAALAAVAAVLLRSMLFGLAPFDPLPWLAAVLVLVTAVGTASWLPARRAARLDPAQHLRRD